MIGTGDITSTIAAVALALTLYLGSPTNWVSVMLTGLVTVTRTKLIGKAPLKPVTVTAGLGSTWMQSAVLVEEAQLELVAPTPNPFVRAYTHGLVLSPVVHQ